MSDHLDVAPDPVVRAALQLLPVPEHGASFWSDLDAALDLAVVDRAPRRTDPGRVAVAATSPVPAGPSDAIELVPAGSTALVPPALRRRSNLLLSAVAVAAAIVVVVSGTTLVRQRAGTAVDSLALAGDAEERETLISTSTSTAPSRSAPDDVGPKAVLAWVAAVASGDTKTAWDALGPASQAHFGSRSAFAAEAPSLVQGPGAWGGVTPEEVFVTEVVHGADAEVLVVTLLGTVSRGGVRERRADAFPVRITEGVAEVEPFAFAGELEVVVPEPTPDGDLAVVRSDEALIVVVPRGVEAPTIRLDDDKPVVCGDAPGTELTELDDAPGQRCSYRPAGGIRPGKRVLTVAFLAPDGGGVAAESVLFKAA